MVIMSIMTLSVSPSLAVALQTSPGCQCVNSLGLPRPGGSLVASQSGGLFVL